MPRNTSAGYSRDDWRNMLCGSYVRLRVPPAANQVVYVHDVEGESPSFRLAFSRTNNNNANIQYVEFSDETVDDVMDISRPRARLVSVRAGVLMVRPLVRRTRRKGFHPEDYECHFLANHTRGLVSRTLTGADRNTVAIALFGDGVTNTTVRGDGSLAIVTSGGDAPTAAVHNSGHMPDSERAVIGQLAARLGYNEITAPENFGLGPTTASGLAELFNLILPGNRLFWHEATIGNVVGRTINLEESAELLSNLVASCYPEYEVRVNATGT